MYEQSEVWLLDTPAGKETKKNNFIDKENIFIPTLVNPIKTNIFI